MALRSPLAAAVLVLSLLQPLAASAAELKVAHVDLQRVLVEVDDGKAAKARLQKFLDDRQQAIEREQEALRKEKEELDKQSAALNPETRAAKHSDLRRKATVLAEKWEKSRSDAAIKERQEMEPIVQKIDKVVTSIAERDGLTYVLEKRDSGIVFGRAQNDITDEVIRAYNAQKAPADSKATPKK